MISVDVHWHPLPGYFPDNFDTGQLWRGVRAVPLAGVTAPALSPEHLILFLCAHGAKHIWERLAWVCDVARLLQTEPRIDWPFVFAQARQTGTSRILALGLLVARDLLGVDMPPPAAEFAARDPRARALAQTVRERFLANAPIPTPAVEATLFSLRAFERAGHRLRYVFGTFIGPSEAEYRAIRLPPALYLLYYPFRPLRLLVKHTVRKGS